jgi:outer membrane protein assembly factor BamD (BamD/ComL family)
MQFEITDKAAITLTHEFYGAVADGLPIDAALADARKLIFADNNQMEWGTPVLHMRSPDGHIFDIAAPPVVEGGGRREEELQKRLGDLYDQGRSYFWTEQWDQAIATFSQVVALKKDYRDAANKLEEARRQKRLAELYAEAMRAYEARSWPEAIKRLEAVTALDPVYLDTAPRLKEARRQKELADLYAEARRLREAQNWEGVVSVFGRITALDAKYPDPEGLLPLARKELAAIEQARKLDALYRQGLQHMDAGEWPQALKAFEEIQRLQAGYRETEKLLARARREVGEGQSAASVSREDQELAALYAQAQAHYQARRWREALDLFRRVQGLRPNYRDVQAYIAYVEREVAQEQVKRSAAAVPVERSVAPPKQAVTPAPPAAVTAPAAPTKKDTSPVAIAALVIGVVNLCTSFLIIGPPISIIGIIVGAIGLRSKQRTPAIIGIVLCIIGLILFAALFLFGVVLGLTEQF